MNERIKELMAQAGFDPAAIERMGVMPQAEKFAELIVRECSKIAFQNDIAKFTRDGMKIGFEIEQHFGVEQ